MKSSICLLALSASMLLSLPSCNAFIGAPHQTPFNEAEFAKYGAPGTGTVMGQISVVDASTHERHMGDQSRLTLLPVTSYTTEMVDREIRNGVNLLASDSRLRQYVRRARAGPRGEFVIHNVPPGEYYLTGLVEWSSGDDFEYQWACEKIHVGAGQTVQVQVSRNLHVPGRAYLVIPELD